MRAHARWVVALAVTLAAGGAAAQTLPPPVSDTLREASCKALYAGTANAPDLLPSTTFPADPVANAWPKAPARLLPARVYLRGMRDTFNARYEFATRGGEIYAAPRDGGAPGWGRLPLPACFDGRVASISADDDEVIALDTGRRVFTMDNALKDPALFNWTIRWGPPFWFGLGRSLPPDITAWSWSVISPAQDQTFIDSAGNAHPVGTFKDSHIWALRPGGQRLTFFDPWLPDDDSYEMCGPHRGRFRAVNLSASGSTIFVIGAHGDMFTRFYDFDSSGSDPLFDSYSYDPQPKGKANAPIQLPSPPWVRQPKIPGRITSAISVEKRGAGSTHRTLRVEGSDAAGHTGYWEKDVTQTSASDWLFHLTGLPLAGRRLTNPRRDTSRVGQGRAADVSFAGTANGARIEVPDFNVHCTPARLVVTPAGGLPFTLRLHSVDGLRQSPRAPGLDATPREQYGAIEVPPAAAAQPFVKQVLGGKRFTPVTLEVTSTSLTFSGLNWTLTR